MAHFTSNTYTLKREILTFLIKFPKSFQNRTKSLLPI